MLDIKDREYRTINNHRSAISAFHAEIDGHKAGQHPRVTGLLKGIAYAKPPNPKTNAVWDVNILVNHWEQAPQNSELSQKELTLKTVSLLALTAIPRASELALLKTEWLIKKDDAYTFQIEGRAKHSRHGKPTPPITYTKFEPNPKICPLRTVDDYLKVTEPIRNKEDNPMNRFFVCCNKPHGPASKATIRRWLLEAMTVAGIDTNHYKAHSTRSSASTKAKAKGVPLTIILERGNWKSKLVWERHYYRPQFSRANNFQGAILQS
jgi:integrase